MQICAGMKLRAFVGCMDGDAHARKKELSMICEEGQSGTDVYIILSGLVVVRDEA